jgi:folate-binding protein YgfZ
MTRDSKHNPPPAAELAALGEHCGLYEREAEPYLLAGADRLRFLNAYITCDTKELPPGTGRYGFFTSAKGRVLADCTVCALEEALLLELPVGRGEAIAQHLTKYILVDRVTLEAAPHRGLGLAGPEAPAVLRRWLGEELELEPYANRTVEAGGRSVVVVRGPDLASGPTSVPTFTLWTPDTAELRQELLALEEPPVPVGREARETLRIVAGRPRFGVDFDGEHFPKETGLEDEAVSYTKGCYLGQEVVARIHYRGGVRRRLCGLRFTGTVDPEALVGREVLFEEREVGTLTSAAALHDGVFGLAILHERAAAGAEVTLAGEPGPSARVEESPFGGEG